MPIAKITQPGLQIAVQLTAGKPATVLFDADNPERIKELRDMLFRAANTLEPVYTPQWVTNLLDVLDGVPRST